MHGQCSCQGATSFCPLLRLPTVPPCTLVTVCVLSQIQLSPASRPCAPFPEQALPDDSTSYPSLGMLLLPGFIGGCLPASMGVPLLKSLGSGPTCPCHAPNQAHLTCPPPTRAPVSMPGLDSCHRHCFPGPQVAISSGHTHTTGTPMGDGKCLVSPGPGAGLLSRICFWKLLESTVFPRACCVVAMSHQARCQMQCLGGKPCVALHSRHAALSLGCCPQAAVQLLSRSTRHHVLLPALAAPSPSPAPCVQEVPGSRLAPVKPSLVPLSVSVLPGGCSVEYTCRRGHHRSRLRLWSPLGGCDCKFSPGVLDAVGPH